MLVPLIGLIFGLAVLFYAVLAYRGSPLLQSMPAVFKQRNYSLWAVGCVLVALALILGIVGFYSNLNAPTLRLVRILMGSAGLLVLGYQLVIRDRH